MPSKWFTAMAVKLVDNVEAGQNVLAVPVNGRALTDHACRYVQASQTIEHLWRCVHTVVIKLALCIFHTKIAVFKQVPFC